MQVVTEGRGGLVLLGARGGAGLCGSGVLRPRREHRILAGFDLSFKKKVLARAAREKSGNRVKHMRRSGGPGLFLTDQRTLD